MTTLPNPADLTWLICRFTGPSPLMTPGPNGAPVVHNQAEVEIGLPADLAAVLMAGDVPTHTVAAHMILGTPKGPVLAPMAINWRNVAFVVAMTEDAVVQLVARLRNADLARRPVAARLIGGGAT